MEKPSYRCCVFVPFTYQHEPHSNSVPDPNIDAGSVNNMLNDLSIPSSNWTEERIRYFAPQTFICTLKAK